MLKSRKAIAALALVALPIVGALGGALGGASAASAEPIKGQGGAAGCPVEDSGTGQTTTVPVGTHIGIFYCGRDGEWHLGWLVDERTNPVVGPSGPTGPKVGTVAHVAAASAQLR